MSTRKDSAEHANRLPGTSEEKAQVLEHLKYLAGLPDQPNHPSSMDAEEIMQFHLESFRRLANDIASMSDEEVHALRQESAEQATPLSSMGDEEVQALVDRGRRVLADRKLDRQGKFKYVLDSRLIDGVRWTKEMKPCGNPKCKKCRVRHEYHGPVYKSYVWDGERMRAKSHGKNKPEGWDKEAPTPGLVEIYGSQASVSPSDASERGRLYPPVVMEPDRKPEEQDRETPASRFAKLIGLLPLMSYFGWGTPSDEGDRTWRSHGKNKHQKGHAHQIPETKRIWPDQHTIDEQDQWEEAGRAAEYYVAGKVWEDGAKTAESLTVYVEGSMDRQEAKEIIEKKKAEFPRGLETSYLNRISQGWEFSQGMQVDGEELTIRRLKINSEDPKEILQAAQDALHKAREVSRRFGEYQHSFLTLPAHYYNDPTGATRIEELRTALAEGRVRAMKTAQSWLDLHEQAMDRLERVIGNAREEVKVLEDLISGLAKEELDRSKRRG